MDETKVQIGEDVLLDIGIHSDWYISSIGYDYDCESVNVSLRRKADRNKEWWLADTPQTDCETCKYGQDKHRYAHICNECGVGINNYTPQTETQNSNKNSNLTFEKSDCPWK